MRSRTALFCAISLQFALYVACGGSSTQQGNDGKDGVGVTDLATDSVSDDTLQLDADTSGADLTLVDGGVDVAPADANENETDDAGAVETIGDGDDTVADGDASVVGDDASVVADADAGVVGDDSDAVPSCPAPRDESKPTPAIATYLTREVSTGVTIYYRFPTTKENLAGLVFIFHGSGGGGLQMFERIEPRRFVGALLAANYAVAAMDSTNRVDKQWAGDNSADNIDIKNVEAQLLFFKNQNLIDTATRRFYVGISNGGGFASMISYWVPVKATVIFIAGGRDWLYALSEPPVTGWVVSVNDSVVDNSKALANIELMKANNQATWMHWTNAPQPIKANSFVRIPGINAANSKGIYDDLKAAKLLDSCDMLTVDPLTGTEVDVVLDNVPQAYQKDVRDQLNELFAEHSFTSEFNDAILQFFAAQP